MKNRIFRGIFSVAILVWISCLVLILGALYLQYNEQYAQELRMQSRLVAQALETGGTGYFDGLSLAENHRITLIAADGTVEYDSSAGKQEMENHKDRPEVKEVVRWQCASGFSGAVYNFYADFKHAAAYFDCFTHGGAAVRHAGGEDCQKNCRTAESD